MCRTAHDTAQEKSCRKFQVADLAPSVIVLDMEYTNAQILAGILSIILMIWLMNMIYAVVSSLREIAYNTNAIRHALEERR